MLWLLGATYKIGEELKFGTYRPEIMRLALCPIPRRIAKRREFFRKLEPTFGYIVLDLPGET